MTIILKGKKILIGITGSIAAYKIPILVRLLLKEEAIVKVVMTQAATQFVSPLVLSTLSKQQVLSEISEDNEWANHVHLGRWADVMLIAPASCNTLAKMSAGICDNLLLAIYLSAICPVVIAPAMDEDMYHHPSTKRNILQLQQDGVQLIAAEHGELASGLIGMGRMAEPEAIVDYLHLFFKKKNKLEKRIALVTAGPTYENIDPVRFIGNHSSGKMGIAIAQALAEEGCTVILVLGPTELNMQHPLVKIVRVTSASEMYNVCIDEFKKCTIAVMAAAVADYTPVTISTTKIKKSENKFAIELTKTKDILKELGTQKKKSQIVVGFALESNNERDYALKKLHEKNADMIVLNSIQDTGAGFGYDTNKVTLFEKNDKETALPLLSKQEIARHIVAKIIEIQNKK